MTKAELEKKVIELEAQIEVLKDLLLDRHSDKPIQPPLNPWNVPQPMWWITPPGDRLPNSARPLYETWISSGDQTRTIVQDG